MKWRELQRTHLVTRLLSVFSLTMWRRCLTILGSSGMRMGLTVTTEWCLRASCWARISTVFLSGCVVPRRYRRTLREAAEWRKRKRMASGRIITWNERVRERNSLLEEVLRIERGRLWGERSCHSIPISLSSLNTLSLLYSLLPLSPSLFLSKWPPFVWPLQTFWGQRWVIRDSDTLTIRECLYVSRAISALFIQ